MTVLPDSGFLVVTSILVVTFSVVKVVCFLVENDPLAVERCGVSVVAGPIVSFAIVVDVSVVSVVVVRVIP